MKSKLALACAFICAALCPAFAVTSSDYAMEFSVTVSDAVGSKTATDAVIPIQLSMATITDFDYADFQQSNGTDLLITDVDGNALSYEIDLWNPDGTTTVWVKVPTIAAGTVIHVYYKGAANTDNVPTSVWSRFLGVWHFSEESVNGTVANAYDASGHNLTGYDTPKTTSVSAPFGRARQPRGINYQNNEVGGVFLPAMTLNSKFAISGYFNIENCGYPVFFTTKEKFSDTGFHYFIRSTWNMGSVEMLADDHTGGWNSASTGGGITTRAWNNFCFVTDDSTAGKNFWLYVNGVKTGTGNGAHSSVTDNGKEIAVGTLSCEASKTDNCPGWLNNGADGAGYTFCGQMDEIRIQSYANFNADREYFEGATMKDATLLQYSSARAATSPTSMSADFSAAPLEGVAPLEVEFTAVVLHATGACTYSWDFDGDGTVDLVSSSAVVTNTYPERSLNTVILQVVDESSSESVVQKDDLINVLTALTVDCTVPADEAEVNTSVMFTAVVSNAHAGACTYEWDFDGDGIVDETSDVAIVNHTYTVRGKYTLILTVTDSAGDVKSVTKTDIIKITPPGIKDGKVYVDSAASADGAGTQADPFNNLADALFVANEGYEIYVRGTFDLGSWSETVAVNTPNLVITKWGDDKPIFQSAATSKACPNELLSIAATNVVVSDIDFQFTRETVGANKPFLAVNATDCTITRCDFSFTNARANSNGTCGNKGIIRCMSSSNIKLTVSKCTFTDIETYMDGNAGVIFVTDGTTMLENRFIHCSRVMGQAAMNWGASVQFTSNIVVNSTATDESGDRAGALLRGGWAYYCQDPVPVISYNVFFNANNDGGSIINIPSKTFQKGALIHHNTIYGFKHVVYDTSASGDWSASFFDNLILSTGAFYEYTNAAPGGQAKTLLKNNACTDALDHGPAAGDFSKYTVADNEENIAAPKFVSLDPDEAGFAQPKVYAKHDVLLEGGWTDTGKYPSYIGAVPPVYMQQGTFMQFR